MENTLTALETIGQLEKRSFSGMNSTMIVTLVELVNKEEKYWEAKQEERIRPVPNMSSRQYNPNDTTTITCDRIATKEFNTSFQRFLLAASQKKSIGLYVHDGEFGFAPVFSLIKIMRRIGKNEYRYLIKFEKGNFSKDLFSEFVKLLYLKNNLKKLATTGEKIKELSSYDY